jgi:FHA domain-containing protein
MLRGRTLVGRSPRADVRLSGEAASNEHASIYFDGGGWVLRDLTSRNGTKLNGTLLIGRQWPLAVGDRIIFGDPTEQWNWIDGSAPQPQAIRDDGVIVEAAHGVLLLPHEQEPRASFYARDAGWEMDLEGTSRAVVDGEVVVVGDRRFQLSLPNLQPAVSRTRTLGDDRDVRTARAVFRVSLDEEQVELSLHTRTCTKHLGARSFFYMLLVLARTRQSESLAGVASEEAGWTYTDQLATQLGVTPQQVNVDVHRARDVVGATGLFTNPADIVERRRGSGQLRFGLENILVEGSARA